MDSTIEVNPEYAINGQFWCVGFHIDALTMPNRVMNSVDSGRIGTDAKIQYN